VSSQKVKTYIYKVGQTKIEFLVPTSEDSTIAKFLSDRGQGLHHLAFAVDSVKKPFKNLKKKVCV